METPRASSIVKLGLITSAALLLGYFTCGRDWNSSATQPAGYGGGHGFWYRGVGGHGGYGGSSSAHGVSARGGFGASGHAAGA